MPRPKWVEHFKAAVRPSDNGVRHAAALPPGTKVVLLARVSTETQRAAGNLDDAEAEVLRWAGEERDEGSAGGRP
jgi:hypothetical protein